MKEKITKKIMIIIAILIIIVFIIFLIILDSDKNNDFSKTSLSEEIVEKMNKKKKFLVYLSSSDEYQCYLCENTNKIISLYENLYNIKFITFDIKKEGESDYNNLLKKLNIKKEDVSLPSVIFIKNGYSNALLNEVADDVSLKEYLARYKFIKINDNEKMINTAEKFTEVYNSSNKQIVFMYDGTWDGIRTREKIFDYSIKYNFFYYYIQYGLGDTPAFYDKLRKDTKNKLKLPAILIVSNGKVNSYVDTNNSVNIEEFLRKNNVITE